MGTFENVFKVSKKMAAMPDYNYMYVSVQRTLLPAGVSMRFTASVVPD